MLGIPHIGIWIVEVILFVVAGVLGFGLMEDPTPWWAWLGFVGAVIILVLVAWANIRLSREQEP
jgi:uncharacterized membrane protein YdcZ (DUF606 family)